MWGERKWATVPDGRARTAANSWGQNQQHLSSGAACWKQTWTLQTPRHGDSQRWGVGVRDTTAVLFKRNHKGETLLISTCLRSLPLPLHPHPQDDDYKWWRREARRVKACTLPVGSRLFSPLCCLICKLFDLLLLIWALSPLKAEPCKQRLFSSLWGLEDDGFWVINPPEDWWLTKTNLQGWKITHNSWGWLYKWCRKTGSAQLQEAVPRLQGGEEWDSLSFLNVSEPLQKYHQYQTGAKNIHICDSVY